MKNKLQVRQAISQLIILMIVVALTACNGNSSAKLAPDEGLVNACEAPIVSPDATPRLQREGRWLIDHHNRVVISHGVNLVWKLTPYFPPNSPEGFTAADADWLVEHGFNTARIGTLWIGVSPTAPGQIDHDYLVAWDRIVQLLAERGIWILFDFHQDMLGEIYQGEGVPEWGIPSGISTSLLGSPALGFPFNYFTPQVSEAFDKLWAEQGQIWQGYSAAWQAVASKWANQNYSMGYDLLNEPWAGLEWPTCIVPEVGCPAADREIQPFFEHAITAIRSVDSQNMVWIEPQLLAGGTGTPTGFTAIAGESQLGYSVHNYCPLTALLQAAELGLPIPDVLPDTCEGFEAKVFEQARITSERIAAVELVTEFGASDDPVLLNRVANLADSHLTGWQYWAYKNWSDPTTQSQESGAQGLFVDDGDLNSAKLDKLKELERGYPQATAGIPLALSFDSVTGDFHYRYQIRPATADTQIYLPKLHYPNGYSVEVSGATVSSVANANLLMLKNNSCEGEVEVTIHKLPL
jgi:endoglycosylceramidase